MSDREQLGLTRHTRRILSELDDHRPIGKAFSVSSLDQRENESLARSSKKEEQREMNHIAGQKKRKNKKRKVLRR